MGIFVPTLLDQFSRDLGQVLDACGRNAGHEHSKGEIRTGRVGKYELLDQACFLIATMARVLGVSRAGFYAWRHRPPSLHAVTDAALLKQVRTVHANSRQTYGAPRVHADLRIRGERHGRKRIARLMRKAGLVGVCYRHGGPTTTRRDKDAWPAPDLVEPNFTASGPNQLWVGDITYVPTVAGFLYLVVVLDAWSRKIVGWSMANHLRAELVLDTMEAAVGQRRSKDVFHHSDQGSQGEFNWPSQHPWEECWDGGSASVRSCVAEQAAVAGATSGCATDAPAAFLGIDRRWPIERGRGDWCGRVGTGRSTLVWEAGGMPPSTLARSSKLLSGRYLSFAEREELPVQHAQGLGVRQIACNMGRSGSTISREMRRNAATRGGELDV